MSDFINDSKTDRFLSWPVVILSLFLFWPLGLVLLFFRLHKYRNESLTAGKTVKIIGLAFAVFCIFGFIALTAEGEGMAFYILLPGIGGFILFFYGRNLEKEGRLFKRYLQLVVNEKMTSIPLIASQMNVSEETAVNHLQKMISKDFLADSRVDRQNMIVVVSAVQKQIEMEEEGQQPQPIKCDSCGANNLITGRIAGCEFCGSHLSQM